MAKPILSPIERFESKFIPEPNSGCWLWMGFVSEKGYGQFSRFASALAHRASWMLYRGPIPDGLLVCHKCDVRSCVNPDHLFVGTPQDNSTDMTKKGRAGKQSGTSNPRSRLSDADVIAIRKSDEPRGVLAGRYGVAPCTISNIRRRFRWSHIQ